MSFFDVISISESYNFLERELSLLKMDIRDCAIEEKQHKEESNVLQMKIKFYQHSLGVSEARIAELEEENRKLRKRLRPSFFRRLINRLRGYQKIK